MKKKKKTEGSLLLEEREPIKNRAKRMTVRMVRGGKPKRKHGGGMGDVFRER